MSLTTKRTGSKPDMSALSLAQAKRTASVIAGIIRARVARGIDVADKLFARYDRDYAKKEGQRVDLDAGNPGGLLSTLVVTVRAMPNGGAIVIVTPDAAHMAVGGYIQRGTPHMVARRWLGLSPKDLIVLRRATIK